MGIGQYVINRSATLMGTLRHMDDNKAKYVIAVDDTGKVLGTITDGDIRRGLLKGIGLDSDIGAILNGSFQYLTVEDSFDKVVRIFHEERFDFIPILNGDGSLHNIMTRHILNAMLLTNQPMTFNYDFDAMSDTVLEHEIFIRPWGYYKTMVLNDTFQSKVIHIMPMQSLSLQSHQHRDEYWTIISGRGRIQLDDLSKTVGPGEMFSIPKGCKHRLSNDGTEELIFTEVQLGDYFGEDDITRYEDLYNRN